MSDSRYNDISCKLRRIALDLEKAAKEHRMLADQLDHITATNPVVPTRDHVIALDAAAATLIDLPAAEMRKAAPAVARANGLQVLPVALCAQQLRATQTARKRRAQTVAVMSALAAGGTLADAGRAAGVSEATARRLRDGWRDR